MKLIGMLDSPYVRRVAISLKCMDLPFEHHSVSVFSTFEQFKAINPVVKAPTLVCDGGEVLMDSSLILDYLESLAGPQRSLMPLALPARLHELRLIGLALAACEKSVQIVYERKLRPAEKQHGPWLERIGGQLQAAYTELEQELQKQPLPQDGALSQAGISLAVAWSFSQMMLADLFGPEQFPAVRGFAEYAEQLPVFLDTPAT
ncbi:glutathione S-transferase [Pseudomonas protegens]|uniref:glutathione S-transferase n=1 Tax=Pseudomonas protegens TaxID=380021 RepID=UPI000F4768CC|nr:glutathione S-transferase [Pseudomonas protegens]ROL84759.1 glutathione S-transferase [Pseudomonas protegens]ROM00516.1 glutathione S-transferase [Pseudomonas protegens]ROM09829.1 glutathione S-transferase [Pseudomonas protegens]ROM10970.1 glutathione S-transferase [Pseudomonas protegens]